LYVASTFALISLCWSVGDVDYDRQVLTDRDLGVGSGGASADDNVSGPSVDSESLFQSSQKIVRGKRWIAIYVNFLPALSRQALAPVLTILNDKN